jgi:polyferredoxin
VGIQIFFFILIALISINRTLSEKGIAVPFLSSASLHAICPFGGVVSIYKLATTGTFVQKIHESSFVLMAIMFIAAIGFGPLFCGWVCPFGSFQEWIGGIGRRVFKKKYNRFVPYKIDNYLRYLRYGVLLWVIYITAISGKLLFSDVDPYYALFHFWSGEVAIQAIIMLMVIIIVSLLVERPWCKYLCPYGAVLGITNLFRIFKIKRNVSTCISCSACDRACPMNIRVSSVKAVRNHQCISCMKCTSEAACPTSETVQMSLKGEK